MTNTLHDQFGPGHPAPQASGDLVERVAEELPVYIKRSARYEIARAVVALVLDEAAKECRSETIPDPCEPIDMYDSAYNDACAACAERISALIPEAKP